MSTTAKTVNGPKRYRAGILLFSTMFTALLLWLGNFALDDIAHIPPPEIEDNALLKQQEDLSQESARLSDELHATSGRSGALGKSTRSSQSTLNQLIELHESTLTREGALSEQAQTAFDTAQGSTEYIFRREPPRAFARRVSRGDYPNRARASPNTSRKCTNNGSLTGGQASITD